MEESESRKPIAKIVTGKVTRRKKSLGAKLEDIFLGSEAKELARYIVWDVFVPSAKDLIFDMVKKGLAARLYGDDVRLPSDNRIRRDRDRTVISFDYNSISRVREREREHHSVALDRSLYAYEDFVFGDRRDAERVLGELADIIDQYNVVAVSDLYDMLGKPSDHTAQKWGWDSLGREARVRPVRDGWVLELPRPIALN